METVTYGEVLARFGHALSDPVRARVLLALREGPSYPLIWPTWSGRRGRICPIIWPACAVAV
jgi:hypothetical protein